MPSSAQILWEPPADAGQHTRLGRYLTWLDEERGRAFADYRGLWEWSVTDLTGFWSSIWDYFEVHSATPYDQVLADRTMPGTWFGGATVNYAEHVLRGARSRGDAEPIIWARSQTRGPSVLTAGELAEQVGRARAGLLRLGVRRGDRVAAYLPNIPETMVAFLAAASIGAVFVTCAPEFGTRSVLDRLNAVGPKVLLVIDGYRFGTKAVDRTAEVTTIRAALSGVETVVAVAYLYPDEKRIPDALTWQELLVEGGPLDFDAVPFDHPLYILHSSGTTGPPKPIVHGHGGMLLEHYKVHALHHDLGPGDRFFWYTTTGWMVWNWAVSVMLHGAGTVLFDGDPTHRDLLELWRVSAETEVTVLGLSAAFVLSCHKAGLRPRQVLDLSAVKVVLSSGSPLPAEGFRWIYSHVAPDAFLASISGGTDVCSAFLGGAPLLPVRAGEIACCCLGAKIEAYDPTGRPVVGEQGELVITEPMPSMPLGFWGDPGGDRYRAAYFADFPGVWRHGDWISFTEEGSATITGRSDATLNRGGVRLGTSEFYAVVEALPEIADSLVVHLEHAKGGLGELVLFVVLTDGTAFGEDVRLRIRAALKTELSPRHVPDVILPVPAIPRALSGKKLEVPVKRILTGTPTEQAVSRGALANPESLDMFESLAEKWHNLRHRPSTVPESSVSWPSCPPPGACS